MVRKLLNLSLLLVISLGLNAQVMTSNPAEPAGQTDACEKVTIPLTIRNVSSNDLNALWKVERVDMEEEWTLTICDAVTCYAEGKEFIDEPGQANNFLAGQAIDTYSFKIDPNDIEGVGDFDFVMFNVDDPNEEYIRIPFVVTVQNCTSAVHDINVVNKINIYPNPTTDMFNVANNEIVESVVVYNIVGKEVKSFGKNVNGNYDVSNLSNGMYLVRMFDVDGDMIKVSRLSKK